MTDQSRSAWQRLYSKHGLQYGGRGDIRPLAPHLRPGMLVLDAGCGDGKTTEVLSAKCDVIGCDFSREALKSFRSQRSGRDVLDLVECNLVYLPFEREKFDAISCVHALGHMVASDRSHVAQELSRVLRPGGHIMVEVFGTNDVRFGTGEEVEKSSFLRGNGIMTHYFLEGEVASLFTKLSSVSETSDIRRITFGSVAGKRELRRILMLKPL